MKKFKNIFSFMLAVGMVTSSVCINSFAEESTEEIDRSMVVSCFNENCFIDTTESGVSDDLQEFIEQQKPRQKINDRCAVYDILYGGVDENGKEIYYPGYPFDHQVLMNERYDSDHFVWHAVCCYLAIDSSRMTEQYPRLEITGQCMSHIVWFDENGKVERVFRPGIKSLEEYDDGTTLYEAVDINTRKEVLMRGDFDAFLSEDDEGNSHYGWKGEFIQSGDANTDGTVDIVDVTTLKQEIVKLIELPDYATISADVDGDGSVDVKDLSLTIKKIIKADAE